MVQRSRFPGDEVLYNSDFGPAELRRFCGLDDKRARSSGRRCAVIRSPLAAITGCSSWRVRLQTWAGEEKIGTTHLAEALQYRPKLLL